MISKEAYAQYLNIVSYYAEKKRTSFSVKNRLTSRSSINKIPNQYVKNDNVEYTVRGKRASLSIYDCSVGCSHLDKCTKGEKCPYEKET